jgi:replicative DNA helicase
MGSARMPAMVKRSRGSMRPRAGPRSIRSSAMSRIGPRPRGSGCSTHSGISHTVIRSGAYNDEQEKVLWATKEKVQSAPLYIDDSSLSDVEVISSIRYHAGRHGVKMAFIDYIQLLSHHNFRLPRHEQIVDISGRLKKLTKELRIPIIPIAQLKREAESKDVKEAGDVGGAYKIAQDADVLITLADFDNVADPKPYNRIVRVGKNRFGVQQINVSAQYDNVLGTLRMAETKGPPLGDKEVK